jgi:hypothetical protein
MKARECQPGTTSLRGHVEGEFPAGFLYRIGGGCFNRPLDSRPVVVREPALVPPQPDTQSGKHQPGTERDQEHPAKPPASPAENGTQDAAGADDETQRAQGAAEPLSERAVEPIEHPAHALAYGPTPVYITEQTPKTQYDHLL